MDYETLVQFIQSHFTDGLVLVIGSGLSSAEGMPGMSELASHLNDRSTALLGADAALWDTIRTAIGSGLEAALLQHAPTDSLELWIVKEVAKYLVPIELGVISQALNGDRTLRLSQFLSKVLKPRSGLPILTTNYDRLVEVACELAGFHVDTTAIGQYAGAFDPKQSCMGSCRGVGTRGRTTLLEHFPRAMVLKPHGSLDWYRYGNDARRCSLNLDADRLIITPGLNKYRAGYDSPFDSHRELANGHVKRAARLLVVGYGFNDDHLQTHLMRRIEDGLPTLILNRDLTDLVSEIARRGPQCICVSRSAATSGISLLTKDGIVEHPGPALWDLGVLASELLA